ncbi:hypothetical protein LO772_01350 [Yinghuangia sp. ASG 101]|uniref:hypothetical protein n=1 Tax=Yinghuangia sp. ASG 101 TaxID=2896848 RepID=UPI001E627D2F|nr:hypothetical protein [Yinghuangia sp. ASG 101]UGQ12285.1 hypothetical protein LO772_01350 [Yinghuangia sp. ASG 101]
MIDDVDSIPNWPVVAIRLEHDGSVTVDGDPIPLGPDDDARTVAMERARHTAELLGRPVRVDACEPDGTVFPMVVDETGDVAEAGTPTVPPAQRRGLLRRRSPTQPRPARDRGRKPRTKKNPATAPTPDPAVDHEPAPEAARAGAPAPPPAPGPSGAPEPPTAPHVPTSPPEVADSATDFTPATAPPGRDGPAPPRPTDEQARVLARVRSMADAGDPRGAVAELREAAGGADGTAGAALREVQAYLMFLAGDPGKASRLYLDVAADPAAEFSDAWALGVVECAHHCWLDVDDVGEAYELGRHIVAAYVRLGAGSSLQIAHARTRQRELRTRLAVT